MLRSCSKRTTNGHFVESPCQQAVVPRSVFELVGQRLDVLGYHNNSVLGLRIELRALGNASELVPSLTGRPHLVTVQIMKNARMSNCLESFQRVPGKYELVLLLGSVEHKDRDRSSVLLPDASQPRKRPAELAFVFCAAVQSYQKLTLLVPSCRAHTLVQSRPSARSPVV